MSGLDEQGRSRGPAGGNATPPADGEYLDVREEWGGDSVAGEPPGPATDFPSTSDETAPVRTRRAAPVDDLPKRKVRGIARGVDIRSDYQREQEKLTFRIDRYDVSGNRLPPVPVEMHRYRGGLVTDGDEVEVVGRWSRGTLRASRINNLTTSSEVRGWFAGAGKWVLIAFAVAVLAALAVVAFMFVSFDKAGGTVAMPNVVGQQEAAALSTLRDKGLSPTSRREASAGAPAGQVTGSDPPANFPVRKSTGVSVIVSSGPATPNRLPQSGPPPQQPKATVPTRPPTTPAARVVVTEVVGSSGADATNVLRDLGLSVTVVQEANDAVPEGAAIRTNPPAGTSVRKGSAVKLFISSGPATSPST
jgi:hypothetical protein